MDPFDALWIYLDWQKGMSHEQLANKYGYEKYTDASGKVWSRQVFRMIRKGREIAERFKQPSSKAQVQVVDRRGLVVKPKRRSVEEAKAYWAYRLHRLGWADGEIAKQFNLKEAVPDASGKDRSRQVSRLISRGRELAKEWDAYQGEVTIDYKRRSPQRKSEDAQGDGKDIKPKCEGRGNRETSCRAKAGTK